MPRGSKLSRANAFIAARSSRYTPLGKQCCLLQVAAEFQVPAFNVALAASLYQRVVTASTAGVTVVTSGWDQFLCDELLPHGIARFTRATFQARYRDTADLWPLVIYAACLHLAVKAVHIPRNSPRRLGGYGLNNMLKFMCNIRLHHDDMRHIETWILVRLKYRILPAHCFKDSHRVM